MKTIEYGSHNSQTVLLLHGGGLSYWNYHETALLLQDRYHVVLPILDGHAESDRDFLSIEENAREIIRFIDERFGGSVLLIGGVSLGAQITAEILSQRSDICRFAIIESASVIPMPLTHCLIGPMTRMSYGLIQQPWFAKLQFKALKIKPELFDVYYRDTCKITKENMVAFLQATSAYRVKESIGQTTAETYIFAGQKEQPQMLRSARLLHRMIPGSVPEILSGLYHGEFSINRAAEYADRLRKIVGDHTEP